MSILTRWLLIPPVNARLIGRYRDYRRHGASAFSATLGCFWMILAWIFIPLEHPRWQRIRAEHKNLYPHINASRPRPLDPVRYLIQTCWLLIGASRKETPKPRRRAFSGLQNIRGRYHQWMNELPERVSHKTQHLDEKKELGHLSAGARRLILGIIVTFSLILALICVTQPFNPLAQFIFLMLLWGVALIVRRMPGRFSALMLIVLSLTVSCRYIWWRYTSTLNWDDPVSLVCGLILLFAETYAWIVLVLGYFQVVWPLNRQPVPLPKDMSLWPSVDIFVPTYNEDLNVVKNTMEGLIEEANEVIESTEKNEVRDAALIAAAQKVEHYEIASYGTLATLAEQLGYRKAAKLLKETLEEEKATDIKLTDLAINNVNKKAENKA